MSANNEEVCFCEGCEKVQSQNDLFLENAIIKLGSDLYEERGLITLCCVCWKKLVLEQLEYSLENGEDWEIEEHKRVLKVVEEYCK